MDSSHSAVFACGSCWFPYECLPSDPCIPLAHGRWQQEQHFFTIRVGVIRQHRIALLTLDTYIHLQLFRDGVVVGPCIPHLPVFYKLVV